MWRLLLLTIGALFIFIGDFSYLADTLKGRVKPNRVTWLLWGIIPLIVFFAQLSKSVGIESLLTLVFGLMPLVIFLATFFNKKSVWRLTKFDLACGTFSFLGIIAWYVSKNGTLAIVFSMIADFFASAPTIKKSYTNPETETYKTYFFNGMAAALALFTIEKWNFDNYVFILITLLYCLLFVALIRFKIGKRLSKYLLLH